MRGFYNAAEVVLTHFGHTHRILDAKTSIYKDCYSRWNLELVRRIQRLECCRNRLLGVQDAAHTLGETFLVQLNLVRIRGRTTSFSFASFQEQLEMAVQEPTYAVQILWVYSRHFIVFLSDTSSCRNIAIYAYWKIYPTHELIIGNQGGRNDT